MTSDLGTSRAFRCHFDQREKSCLSIGLHNIDFSLAHTGIDSLAAYTESCARAGASLKISRSARNDGVGARNDSGEESGTTIVVLYDNG
jgi:hypothetical protein